MHLEAVRLTDDALRSVKRVLVTLFPGHKSSHLSEAMACSLGYSSNAALIAFRKPRGDFPDFAIWESSAFTQRLAALAGGLIVPEGWDNSLKSQVAEGVVRFTGNGPDPGSPRNDFLARLGAEILTSAANEGLRLQLFSLVPNDNRWGTPETRGKGVEYPFRFGPFFGWARVTEISCGELTIKGSIFDVPVMDASAISELPKAHSVARASSWMERERGHWLQDSRRTVYFRRGHMDALKAVQERPAGFAKRGALLL